MASQQLHSYLGRAGLWRNVSNKLAEKGTRLAPCDAKALKDLCAGVTWMQRVPPAVLASYRALYVILRGDAADAEEEINRDILRTVRAVTGLLLDFSQDQRGDFAGSINRVLNALAHVDDMGYCQGQNYVVDVMMKAGLPERETFCLFLYLLRQGHLHGIYRKEVPMLAGYMDKFEEQLRLRLPKLAAHFEAEHYPPPLYALEWITTLFGLAAQPLISLVALDLFLAGARNPVLRMCVSLLGGMEDELLALDQEGLLKEFRSRAVEADAEEVIVRALSDGGGRAAEVKRSRAGADRHLGWSTGPDYLLVLRSRHCQTVGLVELREEAKNGLLVQNSDLQDALLAVTRSIGWGCLRSCWMRSCLVAGSDHERYLLASESLRFVITNGGHSKAAAFLLGVGGADANGVDSRLLSCLHLVALFNRPDVARVLLMCGASPQLVGGVTRAAAARGGKLWSPLEMAEEACTEGGELDDAGVAVGPAALFVLRGLVCLQCNIKLPKPKPCGTCNLTFCSMCLGKHYCVGKLDLPRGVAESVSGAAGGDRAAATAAAGESKRGGASSASSRSPHRGTRWELGSAIGDNWEALFSEKNANARGGTARAEGQEEWKPGGLRRAESGMSKTTEEDIDFGATPGPWTTMASVLLGTWERRPLTSSPCDRDKLFDNSAAFVRACFPAQTWLQHHMEEEMGLSLRKAGPQGDWGGPLKGLGMHGEYFNPVIMRAAASTELHRRMSWVMAESGVPWEDSDQTWCCPECFILFSLNVFRHHCRGCGQVYCSAHAPPTEVPPGDRSLKLCWSCVLEGAAPLPSPLVEDDVTTMISLSPTTARGVANGLSPTAAPSDPCAAGAVYVPPQPPSPLRQARKDDDDERQRKKDGGGFLSALVSLIEVVAAPATPVRSRGASRPRAGRDGEASKSAAAGTGAGGRVEGERKGQHHRTPLPASRACDGEGGGGGEGGGDLSLSSLGPTGEARVASGFPPRSPVKSSSKRGGGGGGAALPRRREQQHQHQQRRQQPPRSPTSSASLSWQEAQPNGGDAAGDSAGGDWRGGWSTPPPPADRSVAPRGRAYEGSPPKLKLERGFGSSLSTASSTEPGDDYEAHLRRGGGGGSGPANGVVERGGASSEKPVELGFPSERPWAHGFGSG